jgi:hypothetical protein
MPLGAARFRQAAHPTVPQGSAGKLTLTAEGGLNGMTNLRQQRLEASCLLFEPAGGFFVHCNFNPENDGCQCPRHERGSGKRSPMQKPSRCLRTEPPPPILVRGVPRVAERIGDFLVRTGRLTQAQVEQVLGAQKAGDSRTFGEIAVGLNLVDAATVSAFLASQGK